MTYGDLRFYGTWRGKKIYRIFEGGRTIFTGTKGECRRFQRLHEEKQLRDLTGPQVPRRRKVHVKRYRVSPRCVLTA